MASRGVRPSARAKSSGLPWYSRLTNIASPAGLTAPVIYGGVDRNAYIVETIGCGVAFVDYDNDGWLDIFVLSGTRLEGAPPGATNRLYKNNRDGTFTDVTEKRRPDAHRLGVGRHHRRLQQRRLRRYLHHLLGPERAVSQQRRRHVHRRDARSRLAAASRPLGLRLHALSITTATAKLDLFVSRLIWSSIRAASRRRANPNCNWKGVPVNCGPRGLPPGYAFSVSQQRRRHVHRCQPSGRHSERPRAATA